MTLEEALERHDNVMAAVAKAQEEAQARQEATRAMKAARHLAEMGFQLPNAPAE